MVKEKRTVRQSKIKELIIKECISDQKQLVDMLRKIYGIETNQTVVSRDLRALGVIKKSIEGKNYYEFPQIDSSTEILKLAIVKVEHNEAMIVISTNPGLAPFVGDYIDQYLELQILGSLAGENVVFVIPKTIKKIKNVYALLCEKIHYKTKNGL